MVEKKLFDSEIKIMQIVWQHEPVTAKDVSAIAADSIGWNKNTTYTVLKKLVAKGAVKRTEPGFVCTSLIERNDVGKAETESLINRFYSGSKGAFFSAMLADGELTADEIEQLRAVIKQKRD